MVDEATLDLVRSHMRDIRSPGHHDKVYKEECAFSFATPLSQGGLYLNLKTWQGYSAAFVGLDQQRTGNVLYLWEKWHKVPLSEEETAAKESKPEKMAIGGDGGFQVDAEDFKIEKESALAIMPGDLKVSLPCPELPELVINAINTIVAHDSAGKQEEVTAWEAERRESRYARDLPQLPATKKIPSDPKEWRCEESGAQENLWLNLSTGYIGSGRPQWGGAGGTGAALKHFEATGNKYPLAVKLGTITPHGTDVYSYAPDEDDMVTDPLLAQHLAHWGINMMQMEKSEKTMAELEIDQNIKFEWDSITESGSALKPLAGPGYVGLKNLGNSCYMNSVLQLLWTLPPVSQRYTDCADGIYRSAPAEPATDFPTQMAKVGVALTQGRTGDQVGAPTADGPTDPAGASAGVAPAASAAPPTAGGAEAGSSNNDGGARTQAVRPQAFKALVGKGHPEFSSNRQQDAVEYFEYLMEHMARTERTAENRLGPAPNDGATPDIFRFGLETRTQDLEGGAVSYQHTAELLWPLHVPLDAATNRSELEEYQERERKRQKLREEGAAAFIGANGATSASRDSPEDPVRPKVPFAACVERWAEGGVVDDYQSAALGRKTRAQKADRFSSFPPYLMVQLKKYYVGEDWTPKKLHVEVAVPDALDLEHLRAKGPQPGEQLQPEVAEVAAAGSASAPAAASDAAVEPDPTIVTQLMSMGFGENGCKRAAVATQNAGAEACMEWVLAHMEDADFNDPLPHASPAAAASSASAPAGAAPVAGPEAVAQLTAMGFTDAQASVALQACSGSLERAADWLFSHADDLEAAVASVQFAAAGAAAAPSGAAALGPLPKLLDGPGKYSLLGFVSHMGASTATGHYVAHIRKEGRWVIFNDEKVAESAHPPRDLGYMYLFKRDDMP